MDKDRFGYYNATDAAVTFQIRDAFWQEFLDGGHKIAYDRTMRILDPVMYMMARGIKIDLIALEKLKGHLYDKQRGLQEELNSVCGRELNVNSPKDCQRYFYVEKGIAPYYNHKTKTVTTDDLAMARIARGTAKRAGLREANLVQQIRGTRKLIGTYLDISFDDDGRMRCSYNLRGTRTGRLSSSKTIYGTGTNNQNLPPEVKQFLVADDGCFLIEMDKRQAEWVVVAYLAQDANMMDVIANGRDPHIHTAHLMFGADPNVIKAEAKMVGNTTDAEYIAEQRAHLREVMEFDSSNWIRSMSLRQCGKKSNHGLNYDEGAPTFSLLNEIPQGEAKRVVDLYHEIYPNIRGKWYKEIQAQLSENRTIENCFGRKYHFIDSWGDTLFKAAYAFQPQSTVVDSLNEGMASIYEDQRPHMRELELLGQVHDSCLFQLPLTFLPQFHKIASDCYSALSPDITYHGRTFQIATDMKIGYNWGTYNEDTNPQGMRELELCKDKRVFHQTAKSILGV